MESRISKSCTKIAAFDLDHTLLKPIGKARFPKNRDDAELVFPQVSERLLDLQKRGYKIVIFTNQKGLGKKIQLTEIYHKVDKYLPNGSAIDIYISFESDHYRKPLTGMFEAMQEHNGPLEDVFYVGDAAGRDTDFSASDLHFAHNCKIKFYTPEQFFLELPDPTPAVKFLTALKDIPWNKKLPPKSVVILIGAPATGKSTFSAELMSRYPNMVVVNNDTSGSISKTLTQYKRALESDCLQIIVDNTNPTVLNRVAFIEEAKNKNYKVYAVTMELPKEYALHLNHYRCVTQKTKLVPLVAYSTYYSRYQEPSTAEGYNKIFKYLPKLPNQIWDWAF
jgi:bifunctional polynucleotide phosphatase/kinase